MLSYPTRTKYAKGTVFAQSQCYYYSNQSFYFLHDLLVINFTTPEFFNFSTMPPFLFAKELNSKKISCDSFNENEMLTSYEFSTVVQVNHLNMLKSQF